METNPLRILLADDDEADRLLFKEALTELNLNTVVDTVKNGVQLMEWLRLNAVCLPQLLFLDLNMPLKSGLECLKEIRSCDKIKDVFIAIYSTSDNERDQEDTFRNGANVYITKPADFNKLKLALQKTVQTAYRSREQSVSREEYLLKI